MVWFGLKLEYQLTLWNCSHFSLRAYFSIKAQKTCATDPLFVPPRLINIAKNTKKLPCFQTSRWKQCNAGRWNQLANQEPVLWTGVDRWEECHPFENEQHQTLSKQERKLAQFSARGMVQVMRVGFGVTSFLLTLNKIFFCFVAELLPIK